MSIGLIATTPDFSPRALPICHRFVTGTWHVASASTATAVVPVAAGIGWGSVAACPDAVQMRFDGLVAEVADWAAGLGEVHARIAGAFARTEPRARVLAVLRGLIGQLER